MKYKTAIFWSGGKDSAYALYWIQHHRADLDVIYLVTTINEEYRRISMHGVREEMVEKQSVAIGIPLLKMIVPNLPTNSAYENELSKTLVILKEMGISHVIFGDIFLEDLKAYRLKLVEAHSLTAIFPLWKHDTLKLAQKFCEIGFRTLTCCVNDEFLDEQFLGKELSGVFLDDLPPEVDPCGENGEFHTFCFDGPNFKHPIPYQLAEKKYVAHKIKSTKGDKVTGFWYIDII